MIVAEDLVVERGGARILDGVSVRVPAGAITAILGANGAGKSTLVRTFSGDAVPDAGRVTVLDVPVERRTARALARLRAVMSQSSSLEFPFTVFEVALLGRTPHLEGGERPRDHRVVLECLEAAQVAHLRDRSYLTLSGGERQRVHLARALAQIWEAPRDRRCVILDEPTAGLDLTHQHTALALARRLADGGATVTVVLHDMNLAARYADHLVVMKRGRIVARGDATSVLTPDCLADAFGVRVAILDHPEHDCPHIVALGPTERNHPPCNDPQRT